MSLLYGRGDLSAPILLTTMPRAEVQRWLPAALELGSQPVAPGDRWPVALMFGTQSGVRPNIWPCGGLDYQEFAVILPWLQLRGADQPYRGPFAWSPQLFLNNKLAIALGKYIYGLDKIDAVITDTGTTWAAATKGFGYPLVEGRFGPPGAAATPDQFARINAVLQQPIVSVFPDGSVVFYGFEWNLAFDRMHARRVDVAAGRFFLSGLPGREEYLAGEGFEDLLASGFDVQTTWHMMPPARSSKGMEKYLAPWPGGWP